MLSKNTNGKLHTSEQSIFAWASALGRAGVAVLRISGSHCHKVMQSLGVNALPSPRRASLIRLYAEDETLIDHCLCLYFPAPHSFTGEDVVELHTHGSPAIIEYLTKHLSNHPLCRLAEPGEFSRRAFTNNKMDLVEAEGLADLIDAETTAQHKQAMRQMSGSVGAEYESFRNSIIHALAMMEAYIDFPDEKIPEEVTRQTNNDMAALKATIDEALNDNGVGEKIRDGITVTIVGSPNVGKSTLLNAVAKRDVAIVSEQAGTTRDIIEVHLTLDGYPVTLIDTAGIRETEESIEKEGIRRAKERAEHADIVIAVFDANNPPKTDNDLMIELSDNSLILINKTDVYSSKKFTHIAGIPPLPVSAKTGDGMDEFITRLKSSCANLMNASASPLITRNRHRIALQSASDYLGRFLAGGDLELTTEELRCAANEIAKITGRIDIDDVLDVIFSSFCIGK